MIPIRGDRRDEGSDWDSWSSGERERGEEETNLDKGRCSSVDGPRFVPVARSSGLPDWERELRAREVMPRNLGEWEGL